MSIKSSGMWCDLCGKPILFSGYWGIAFPIKDKTKKTKGHSCDKCQEEYQKKSEQKKAEPSK